MRSYLDLLAAVQTRGVPKADRTGIGTRSLFGGQLRCDLSEGFPLLTTKKLYLRAIVVELLWFLKGGINIAWLHENNVTIWDEWADAQGELGPIYGKQWRAWQAPDGRVIDQLAQTLEDIQTNPFSRRHVVTAWNPADLDKMALAPCHCLFQFHVTEQNGLKHLSLHLYQRSADIFLGVPFNIASYALLLSMAAQASGCVAGDFIHSFGDLHLYDNHDAQARLQLTRAPKALPKLRLNPAIRSVFDFTIDDIHFENYDPWPAIKAPVAV